jgi:hypothetical protein
MRLERKKEIRALIRTIPQLVKAGLVNQAFETEKVIAATFEFSEEFIPLLGGIPQNYLETIQEIYSDLLTKGYDNGYKIAEVKIKSTEFNLSLPDEEFDREIEIRMPIAFGVKESLIDIFRTEVLKYFEAAPQEKLDEVVSQFDKDLHTSYKEGVKDFLTSMPGETFPEESPVEVEKEVEEVEEVIEDEIADDVEEFVAGKDLVDTTAKVIATVFNRYATRDIKALFDMQAEEGKHKANAKMLAEFAEWVSMGKPVDDYIPDETFRVVADTLSKELLKKLEDYAKLLGEGEAETVLRFTLGLGPKGKKATAEVNEEESEEEEGSTYAKLEAYTKLLNNPEAEMILRYTLGLPPKTATAYAKTSIPHGPQGVLTKSEQSQIESLLPLGKSRTYKDIKKASPKLAVYLSKILNDIRLSKISMVEGLGKLKSSMEDLIGDCFGNDGQDYYNHLRK